MKKNSPAYSLIVFSEFEVNSLPIMLANYIAHKQVRVVFFLHEPVSVKTVKYTRYNGNEPLSKVNPVPKIRYK
jgi:hypothetical protein